MEQALAESEGRFNILFDTGAIGHALLAADGTIARANAALANSLGVDAASLSGAQLLNFLHPHDHARALRMLDPQQAHGVKAAGTGQEWRFRHRDGGIVWCQVSGSWLPGRAHGPSLALCVSDTSAKRRLEDAVLRMEKLKAVGALAGGIAHEFNNILAAMLGNISLAESLVEGNAEAAALLTAAEKAGLRARELTQRLITFAAGGCPVKVPTAIDKLGRDALTACLRDRGVVGHLEVADGLWPAQVDPGQIAQVLQNLIANACEALPHAGYLTVRMRNCTTERDFPPGADEQRLIRVDVVDTGPGIAAQQLSRLFDAYRSTKGRRVGLGLATVLSIVKRHGGYVDVASELGRGTTITFWVQAADPGPGAEQVAPPRPDHHFVDSLRVLVMDDEKMVLDMTQAILCRLGAQVAATADGAAAVAAHADALQEGRPFDVLILDLTVPGGMGGIEALAQMKILQPDVKAVVCSGYSADPVMGEPGRFGFAAVLPKPFTLAQLAEVVGRLGQRDAPPASVH